MLKMSHRRFLIIGFIIALVAVFLVRFPYQSHASSGTWQEFTYSGSTGSRSYFVYTPAGYQVGTAVPMIVMLHGCTQTPDDFAAGTRMNALADQKQFIVVYPQQSVFANPALCWNWFYTSNQVRNSGEPAIIAGITRSVERTTSRWTINTHKVYVVGVSAGAAMSVTMGAAYPDLFTAIGVAAGAEYQAATPLTAASVFIIGGPDPVEQGQVAYNEMGSRARVVPTIVFQGTFDIVVHPINGDQVIQQWMETDQLASQGAYNASFDNPTSVTNGQVPDGYSYTTSSWNDNNGNDIEEYWTVDGMGHAWSGGSLAGTFTDPLGPDETQAVYNFFMKQTK